MESLLQQVSGSCLPFEEEKITKKPTNLAAGMTYFQYSEVKFRAVV